MTVKDKHALIRQLRDSDQSRVERALAILRTNGWLADGTLEGVNLQHAHLQGTDLQDANLRKANMRMAHMQNTNLANARLEGAQLSCANLYAADLKNAALDNAVLIKANLQEAKLEDRQLSHAECLWGTILSDGSLYDGRFALKGDLAFALATRIDLNDPIAVAAFYASAEEHPCFSSIDRGLQYATLSTTQLIRKLRSPNIGVVQKAVDELRIRGDLSNGTLECVRLRYANMRGVDLSFANLRMTDLNFSQLQRADLTGASLQGARLNKANLRSALLQNANLEGASLTGGNLQGISDVTPAQLAKTSRLRGTTMPDGTRYDGRYKLDGDLADARFMHLDTNNNEELARFYGVTLEGFIRGPSHIQANGDGIWQASDKASQHSHIRCDLESLFALQKEVANARQ